VAAEKGDENIAAAVQFKFHASRVADNVGGEEIVLVAEAEGDFFAFVVGDGVEQGLIVAIDDEEAAFEVEAFDDAGFFAADAHQIAKAFEMFGRTIRDDGDVGAGHEGEGTDFAVVIGADFQDQIILVRIGGKNGQRDPDVVVETFGRDRAAFVAAEGGVDQVLRAGFAVGAADGDDVGADLFSDVRGELGEGGFRALDFDEVDVGEFYCGFIFDESGHCAFGGGVGEKGEAIALGFDGDE